MASQNFKDNLKQLLIMFNDIVNMHDCRNEEEFKRLSKDFKKTISLYINNLDENIRNSIIDKKYDLPIEIIENIIKFTSISELIKIKFLSKKMMLIVEKFIEENFCYYLKIKMDKNKMVKKFFMFRICTKCEFLNEIEEYDFFYEIKECIKCKKCKKKYEHKIINENDLAIIKNIKHIKIDFWEDKNEYSLQDDEESIERKRNKYNFFNDKILSHLCKININNLSLTYNEVFTEFTRNIYCIDYFSFILRYLLKKVKNYLTINGFYYDLKEHEIDLNLNLKKINIETSLLKEYFDNIPENTKIVVLDMFDVFDIGPTDLFKFVDTYIISFHKMHEDKESLEMYKEFIMELKVEHGIKKIMIDLRNQEIKHETIKTLNNFQYIDMVVS